MLKLPDYAFVAWAVKYTIELGRLAANLHLMQVYLYCRTNRGEQVLRVWDTWHRGNGNGWAPSRGLLSLLLDHIGQHLLRTTLPLCSKNSRISGFLTGRFKLRWTGQMCLCHTSSRCQHQASWLPMFWVCSLSIEHAPAITPQSGSARSTAPTGARQSQRRRGRCPQ
jgi:hypothetical protein